MENISKILMSSPMTMDFGVEAKVMLAAGIVNLICAIIVWRPFREERSELVGAFFAFLVYQAISMFSMGLALSTHITAYANLSSLAVFIGSVYMLKFVFSPFTATTRRVLFSSSLILVLVIFAWFLQTPERNMLLDNFIIWYDIAVIGILVGGSIIVFGVRTGERWLKFKALGGGSGIVTCCVVSKVALIGGGILASSIFQFLAPLIILSSLVIARKKQTHI